MEILKILLTIIFVLDCVALTFVVLKQEGKDQGLGALAGNSDTYWGKNKGRSGQGLLKKLTKIMVIVFFVLAAVLNMM